MSMRTISVITANYLNGLSLEIVFNDNKKKKVDLSDFFETHTHPQYNKYKKVENFKKFKIENGNLVWGKDWDMIFPVYDLYEWKIKLKQ